MKLERLFGQLVVDSFCGCGQRALPRNANGKVLKRDLRQILVA